MGWHFTGDVEEYARHAVPLLAADPVRHTVPLGVIEVARARRTALDEPELFGWWTAGDGAVQGAVSHTPPFDLLLSVMPDDALRPLAHALHEAGRTVPGVQGNVADAAAYAAIRNADFGGRAELKHLLRLHRLGTLIAPPAAASGSARIASRTDRSLLVEWLDCFAREIGTPFMPRVVDERLVYGGLHMWEDDAGNPVALAGRTRPAGGVVRVGPVYTPPEHRECGFGTAVAYDVSAAALATGATDVVLFTDVANPTSNAIYERLGYRAVGDVLSLRFAD
jgi:GNAT superfamily N-acetyltransferase